MKLLGHIALFASVLMVSCNNDDTNSTNNPPSNGTASTIPTISYTVTGSFPHDTSSYTEGLLFYNGQVLESGGNYGQSKLFLYDLKTGKASKSVKLQDKYFGEGTCIFRDTIYQMTWKEKTVFVYDKNFKKIKELPLPIEGWGLTTDGTNLIASDGSSNLYFFEPTTFRLLRTQGITEAGMPISNINELEYINGIVYANIYQTNTIIKIDLSSGQVIGKMDLSTLEQRAKTQYPNAEVLNGIAYDPTTKKFYVTGKYWPETYELQIAY